VDALTNPYAPGAGRQPVALVGRDEERELWSVSLQRWERGRSARSLVLYGLRGVGKTVLLRDFARQAASRDWLVAFVEAGAQRSLREALSLALREPLADLARPTAGARLRRALRTFTSFQASVTSSGSWTFGLDLSDAAGPMAGSGAFEQDLRAMTFALCDAAQEDGRGVVFLVDEAQDLTGEELSALSVLAHAAGQEDRPLLLGLAGLPSLPRVLAEARSYTERLFGYHQIERLDESAAAAALTEPAQLENVAWEPDAVEFVVAATQGYPYFLQEYGQASWEVAAASPIGLQDARVGGARGQAALDNGFFRARWDRATRTEQAYLRAMAQDAEEGSATGTLAARLGKKQQSLGPTRAGLIGKGLVYAPEHGVVAFTVPGMAAFIERQKQE
jgi:hypothetical protein